MNNADYSSKLGLVQSLIDLRVELLKFTAATEKEERLRQFRQVIDDEFAAANGFEVIAALADLRESVSWCSEQPLEAEEAAYAAVHEKVPRAAQCSPAVALAYHRWGGLCCIVKGMTPQKLCEELTTCARYLADNDPHDTLPGGREVKAIIGLAQPIETTAQQLFNECESRINKWYELRAEYSSKRFSLAFAHPGGPLISRYRHILIVDDETFWRISVENEVQKALARLDLHKISVHTARHCERHAVLRNN